MKLVFKDFDGKARQIVISCKVPGNGHHPCDTASTILLFAIMVYIENVTRFNMAKAILKPKILLFLSNEITVFLGHVIFVAKALQAMNVQKYKVTGIHI